MNETVSKNIRHWDIIAYETRDMEVVLVDSDGKPTTPVKMCRLVESYDFVRATTYSSVLHDEIDCPTCRDAFCRQIYGRSYADVMAYKRYEALMALWAAESA